MNTYIGFKMINAEPMTDHEFAKIIDRPCNINSESKEGYKVIYPDGYVSWSPKDVFEKAYLRVGENNTIVETNVQDFIKDIEYKRWGDKTTIAKATLVNGFVITESSSCVDPANFNMDIGSSICKDKIYNKIWELLGFLLQTAKEGIK